MGLKELMVRYFENVFSESASGSPSAVEAIQCQVTIEQNDFLHKLFSVEEIKDAFFSMHQDKGSGVDGLNPGFYKHFWNLIGDVLTKECLQILSYGTMPDSLRDTSLVLLPKIKCLEHIEGSSPNLSM